MRRQEWNDDYLTWNPVSYDGVEQIILSPTKIWIPDIGIQNRLDIITGQRISHCIYTQSESHTVS